MAEQVMTGGEGEAPQVQGDSAEEHQRRIEDDEEAELDEAEVEGGSSGEQR